MSGSRVFTFEVGVPRKEKWEVSVPLVTDAGRESYLGAERLSPFKTLPA